MVRHRIARHLRHALRERINSFPNQTQIVVRVIREARSYTEDLDQALARAAKKAGV